MEVLIRFLSGNFALKTISVLIAIVLWFVVLGSQQVEVTKDIDLQYQTDDNLLIANEPAQRVTLKLSVPKAFKKVVESRPEKPLTLSLLGKETGWHSLRIFSDFFKLPFAVKLISIHPEEVKVHLQNVRSKRVPIKADTIGALPAGYKVESIKVEPSQIQVKGTLEEIRKLNEVSTKVIDLNDMVESSQIKTSLEMMGARWKVDNPEVLVTIKLSAESPNFKISNIPISILSSHKAKLSQVRATVYVRALSADLVGLDQSKVIAEVNLTGKPKGKYSEKVVVKLPKRVTLVRVAPETVSVVLY